MAKTPAPVTTTTGLDPATSQPGCIREDCGARAVVMVTSEAGANEFFCEVHA